MTDGERHDRIVAALVADAAPVRRLRPGRLFAFWLLVLAAVLAAFLPRRRPDLAPALARPAFLADVLLLAGAGIAAAWLALRAALPDRPVHAAVDAVVLATGAVGIALFATGAPAPAATLTSFVAKGAVCAVLSLVMAALPWALLVAVERRGAPTRPLRAGLFAGAAALFAAAAGMRLGCAADDPVHLLVWHAGPVVLGVAGSAALGRAWLARWWLSGRGPAPAGGASPAP